MTVDSGRLDVELLATVRAVAVAEQPEILQHVQRPVDRRGDRARIHGPAALDQLGARDVPIRAREDIDQRPALWRPAQPAGPKPFANIRPVRDRSRLV